MKRLFGFVLAAVPCLLAYAQPAVDLDEMMKWGLAQQVHYEVVAEYAGTARVLVAPQDSPALRGLDSTVTDRYELGFDWDPNGMTLLSDPVVRNFPSTVDRDLVGGVMFGQPCPAPEVGDGFEFMDVVAVKTGVPGSNTIELSAHRTHPSGRVAYAGEGLCNNWQAMPGSIESVMDALFVPPGMYFASGAGGDPNVVVDSAQQSIRMANAATGWRFTYIMRIVK